MKKLPDCRKSPAKTSGKRRWACSIASPPRLAPAPTGARTATASAIAGSTRVGERARVQRARRVPLVALAGRQQRHAMARQRPGGDLRGRVVGEPRELIELGAVVGDEQRQALVVAASSGRQRVTCSSAPSALDATVSASVAPGHPLGGQPRRLLVARQRHHRLLAERAGRAQRVGRIGPVLVACRRRAGPRARTRSGRAPAPASAASIRRPRATNGAGGDREAAIGRQPHAGELLVGVGEAEGDRVAAARAAPVAAIGDDTAGRLTGTNPAMAVSPPSSLSVLLVGGPTAVLEYAGLRLLTDPTFDPPGEQAGGLTKLTGPAVSADDVGADRRRAAVARPALRQPRRQRARVPAARRAHADHRRGRRRLGGNAVGLEPWARSSSSARPAARSRSPPSRRSTAPRAASP